MEEHRDAEAEEVDDAQHLEVEDAVGRLEGVDVGDDVTRDARVWRRLDVERLLVDEVAEHESGPGLGEGQEVGDL